MNEIRKSKEYEKIARELIKAIPSLHIISEGKIKIAYVTSSEKKNAKGFKRVYADCTKVNELYSPWCKYDFIIRVYEENIIGMTPNQIKILLYHELLHVGIDDSNLEPKYMTNPHDIEDFAEILDVFGNHWADIGADVPNIEDVIDWQTNKT